MKKVLCSALAATMAATLLAGCGGASSTAASSAAASSDATASSEEGKVVNIYCWNTEFQDRYEAYAADLADKHGVTVNFVIVANENNAYQNNLDAALMAQETAAVDDKVDIFLVEADYASKYTKTEYALDVVKDVGLTEDELADQYEYTKDIVTVDGVQKGTTWQATPGLFAYRRSIAKEVLGTDDPVEVQAMLSDWDKFDEVAEKMHASGYKMLSGYDDSFRVFSNNMSGPWVQDGKVVIDPAIEQWIEQTMTYTEKGYNNKTTLWAPEWSADQGPKGDVFGFFYSTWGINFTLLGNSLEDANGPKEVGNGIYGDYAVCEGPQAYYWGGTWMCAAKGTDNIPFIHDLMVRLTCDAETMKQITLDTEDYTNNQTAMGEIANDPNYGSAFLGGQNHVALFAESAKKINMKNICDYDQGCNEVIQNTMHEYFKGNVTKEEALNNFYRNLGERYPELAQ